MSGIETGTTVRLKITVAVDGVPADHDTLVVLVKDPVGNVTQPDVAHDSLANFHADFVVPYAGQWRYRWESTGPVSAKDGSFVVDKSLYGSPWPDVPGAGPDIAESQVINLVHDLAALSSSISAEATTRASADSTLQGHIDSEVSTRASADTALAAGITTEASTRAGADTTLQSHIDAEATARAAADTSEASTRAAADTTLQTNITAEATARASADTAEATARIAGDAATLASAESYSDAALATALAGLSAAEFPAVTQGSGLTHSGIGQTVNGVVVTTGMRVLDTANSSSAGLWVAASGAWTRPVDFATGSNAQGKLVEVDNGGLWLCVATSTVTVSTTAQVWTEIDASAIQAGAGSVSQATRSTLR